MKTTLRILALSLVAVLLVGALAACGPNKDPKKAAQKLKDAGYEVISVTKGDTLGDAAIAAAEKALDITGLEAAVVGSKGESEDDAEYVSIYYFDTAAHAKDAFDKLKKDFEEETKESKKDVVIKKSGKLVYGGTKAAIKAAG